jgi:hypothetical protein
MSGTYKGAVQAAATNKERYGDDFYAIIGKKGGSVTNVTKGFAVKKLCDLSYCMLDYEHYLSHCAGIRGGRNSKRGPSKRMEWS